MKHTLQSYLDSRGILDPTAFKHGVLKNKALDRIREKQREREREAGGYDIELVATKERIEEQYISTETALAFQACLNELRDRHPEMVTLHEQEWDRLTRNMEGKELHWASEKNEGLNLNEAMRRTDLSRDTVERKYREFRDALIRCLSNGRGADARS